jgi:MYXO-CTERM domain-containing protein
LHSPEGTNFDSSATIPAVVFSDPAMQAGGASVVDCYDLSAPVDIGCGAQPGDIQIGFTLGDGGLILPTNGIFSVTVGCNLDAGMPPDAAVVVVPADAGVVVEPDAGIVVQPDAAAAGPDASFVVEVDSGTAPHRHDASTVESDGSSVTVLADAAQAHGDAGTVVVGADVGSSVAGTDSGTPEDSEITGGCGCSAGPGASGLGMLLVGLAWSLRRRR